MSTNQVKLLLELAKKIKSEPKKRSRIIASLATAKIINKKEDLTIHYSNLRRVVSSASR
jgi:hypothetical protein